MVNRNSTTSLLGLSNQIMFVITSIAILSILCTLVSSDTAPILSLSQHYHFDGINHYNPLSEFVCVRGNNARTIELNMKTKQQSPAYLVGNAC